MDVKEAEELYASLCGVEYDVVEYVKLCESIEESKKSYLLVQALGDDRGDRIKQRYECFSNLRIVVKQAERVARAPETACVVTQIRAYESSTERYKQKVKSCSEKVEKARQSVFTAITTLIKAVESQKRAEIVLEAHNVARTNAETKKRKRAKEKRQNDEYVAYVTSLNEDQTPISRVEWLKQQEETS